MKLTLTLQLAAAASAAASAIHAKPAHGRLLHTEEDSLDLASWVDAVKSLVPSDDDVHAALEGTSEYISAVVSEATEAAESIQDEVQSQLVRAAGAAKGAWRHVGARHGHDFPDHTLYDLIKFSEHSTKFAALVDEYPDLVKLLNSTKGGNHTLFVPVDEAFEHLPEHKKPSKKEIEAVLKYHIGIGDYSAYRILSTHTLPTELEEKLLGDEPQRLRTSVGFTGVRVNFYSKVIAADLRAKNGVIHAVRSILVPPPYLGGIVNLFPAKFSTLLLAWKKVDFVKFIHGVEAVGSTLFAPSNSAFEKLGPRANAFLFNTDKGLKYLEALLKYHVSVNATLYSDAFYDKRGGEKEAASEHFDLKSLLGDAHIGVDIATWAGFREYRINGYTRATVQDVVGKNGVIQVVDKVLIPPHKHHGHHGEEDDEHVEGSDISVEELVARLDGYLEEEEEASEL